MPAIDFIVGEPAPKNLSEFTKASFFTIDYCDSVEKHTAVGQAKRRTGVTDSLSKLLTCGGNAIHLLRLKIITHILN